MTLPRRYSPADVRDIVAMLCLGGGMPQERQEALNDLVRLLKHFEYMTDEQIAAEARKTYKELKE